MRKIICLCLSVMMLFMCFSVVAFAEPAPSTYSYTVYDDLNLLKDEESVRESMSYVAQYTNVAVYIRKNSTMTSISLAKELAYKEFGSHEGVVMLIDMTNRWIYIYAVNGAEDIISPQVAETITDNVYKYASNEDYDGCIEEAMRQMYRKYSGKSIPEPMRWIGNALMAIMFGTCITVAWACFASRAKRDVSGGLVASVRAENTRRDITHTTRVYRSSSSGGSRGGRSGGGGGRSGGGGGHRF